MKKDMHMRVSITFSENLEKLFPNSKGTRDRTEKLNKILEEILYGKKK